jgi:probable FeS assembly SUF system protein SufT
MPDRHAPLLLVRDCAATLIPSGTKITLTKGDLVIVTQALGDTITITTSSGYLARIASEDADAIGLEVAKAAEEPPPPLDGPFDMEQVIEKLKTVFDPEIPVNVVDLGLVYGCEAEPHPEGGQRVEIRMSMTAPGCGMGDVLAEEARSKVKGLPGVREVDIELVWDPPWDIERMSDAARLQLGML